MEEVLGAKTFYTMVSFKEENLDVIKCAELVDAIINSIGMQKAHENAIYQYPFDGKGDGYIYIQPIIESFIGVDYWNSLKGGYLTVCSCRPFELSNVLSVLKEANIQIKEVKSDSVGL